MRTLSTFDVTRTAATAATANGRGIGRLNLPHDALVKRERSRPIHKIVRRDAVAHARAEAAARPCYEHFDDIALVRLQNAGVQRGGCNVRIITVNTIAVDVPTHNADHLQIQALPQVRAVQKHVRARQHAVCRRIRGGAHA